MQNDLMIDIETLGSGSNATIVSISAVQFDMKTGQTGEEIEFGIDLLEQMINGSEIDTSTLEWWQKQDASAKNSLLEIHPLAIGESLALFNDWIDKHFDLKKIRLWGNGATFDNVIVRNLYRRSNISFIVPYWADMDVRTWVYMNNIDKRDFPFVGTKHNGLDDCRHQISYCAKKVGV